MEDLEQQAMESHWIAKRRAKMRIFLFGSLALAVLVAAAAFYFFYLGHPSRQALASVNGEKITVEQFHQEVEKIETPFRDMFREEPEKYIEQMIMKVLLLQEAKRQGLSPPLRTYKDTAKEAISPEDALIMELMKKKFASPPEVAKEEIQAFYTTFKDRMEGRKLEQVAPLIEQIIREAKQQQEMEKFLSDLRRNAKIEINQDRLKKIAAKPPESNTEEELKKALTGGKPLLVDFGANSCVPCRQLRPVLKELSHELAGRAQVLVIDVYKYQNLAREHRIMVIPTLVFFDASGKESFRHIGVLEKEKIIAKLKEIGMGL